MECRASTVSQAARPSKSASVQALTTICADRFVSLGKIQAEALSSRGRQKLATAEYKVTSPNIAVARYGSIIRDQNQRVQ